MSVKIADVTVEIKTYNFQLQIRNLSLIAGYIYDTTENNLYRIKWLTKLIITLTNAFT